MHYIQGCFNHSQGYIGPAVVELHWASNGVLKKRAKSKKVPQWHLMKGSQMLSQQDNQRISMSCTQTLTTILNLGLLPQVDHSFCSHDVDIIYQAIDLSRVLC